MSARAEYMREYRARNADKTRRSVRVSVARGRALSRLARQYPREFALLYEEERRKESIEPGGTP